MSLEMRTGCERCEAAPTDEGLAFKCSYECTFWARCVTALDHLCPNCGGELVVRPKWLSRA
jgi:hypothetical protein